MAVSAVTPPLYTATINGANSYTLPTAQSGVVCRWVIELTNSAFNGTLIVKSRLAGVGGALKPVPYLSLYLNGAVGSGGLVTTNLSTGAATGDTLIEVDATEQEIVLDCTAFTSGSYAMTARPVMG